MAGRGTGHWSKKGFAIGDTVAPAGKAQFGGQIIGRDGKKLILRNPNAQPGQMGYRFTVPARDARPGSFSGSVFRFNT